MNVVEIILMLQSCGWSFEDLQKIAKFSCMGSQRAEFEFRFG